ncbi:sugar-binding domain-containing protein [Sunxiuqinia sp. A32]|uniref:sugar-binding domain-containing protein n=1 Tax=Sunxiuqinia sp. A32 TaxID=3461496 RepID=UPI0040453A58
MLIETIKNSKRLVTGRLMVIALLLLTTNSWSQVGREVAEDQLNNGQRYTESFWNGWKFLKGMNPDGAEKAWFNDHDWSRVTIPHDYAMDDPYSLENTMYEDGYSKYSTHKKPGSQGYLPRKMAWYRKYFRVPEDISDKKVFIEFDGVFRDSYTYLNDELLGNNYSGYTSFVYDMTPHIRTGAENVLAVKVNGELNEGWWYEGRGIYRPVKMIITDRLHVAQWGTYVTTPKVTTENATVNIKTEVANEYGSSVNCTLQSIVLDMNDNVVATVTSKKSIGKNATFEFNQNVTVKSPELWCPENPYLYKVVTKVMRDGKQKDEYTTNFGIRTYYFDANKGFFLNGKHYKLYGACNHDDYAGLGMAVPKRIQYENIRQMADGGIILLRGAHNMRAADELDACDKYGVMVWNETRYFRNTDFDEESLKTLIRRDRNHPSVILWSLANEDRIQGTDEGVVTGKRLKKVANAEDPTRPVTSAINVSWALDGSRGNPDYQYLWDLHGYNWINWDKIDADHKTYPDRKFYISEFTFEDGIEFIQKRDYVAGGSPWSGFAYKGEHSWPELACEGKLWNMVHEPTIRFWRAKAEWGFQMKKWTVHVEPTSGGWKGYEGDHVAFMGYTNCEKVEVYLNDELKKTIVMRTHDGTNEWSDYKLLFKKDVALSHIEPFVSGSTLKFVGKNGDEIVDTQVFKPMLKARKIVVEPKPGKIGIAGDVSVVTITIQDENGNIIPDADLSITVDVSGDGKLIGLGSADSDASKNGTEPEKFVDHKHTWKGMLKAIIQSTDKPGKITISASGGRLESGNASIQTVGAAVSFISTEN